MKKIIVAGSRSFNDYTYLKETLDNLYKEEIIIVSGNANGADKLGERYAEEKGYTVEMHLAKWSDISVPNAVVKYNQYGPYNAMAGHNRNQEMLESLLNNEDKGEVVVFWDRKSKGTENMIKIATKAGLPVIINYI